MGSGFKKNNLIERYFDEDLSKDELELFEEKLRSDTKFKDEVKQYEQVIGGLKDARVRKMKKEFRSFEDQIHSRKSKYTFFTKRIMSYSILSGLLLGFIVFGFNHFSFAPERSESTLIFKEYFRPYPNVVAPVTRSVENLDSELVEFMNLYELGQYDAAILGFSELIISNREFKNELLFYKGVALLANGDPSEAVHQFQLMDDTSGSFIHQRKWYLSLALGQLGELREAKDSLNQIIIDESYFMVYAEELLNALSPKQ